MLGDFVMNVPPSEIDRDESEMDVKMMKYRQYVCRSSENCRRSIREESARPFIIVSHQNEEGTFLALCPRYVPQNTI